MTTSENLNDLASPLVSGGFGLMRLEPGAGFEPATFALQERCSDRLSYPGAAGTVAALSGRRPCDVDDR